MTALDFLAAGVAFERVNGRIVVKGPSGRHELLSKLRFEVSTRIDLVAGAPMPRGSDLESFCCSHCGDQIGHGEGGRCPLCGLVDASGRSCCRRQHRGTCDLCGVARQKWLDEQGGAT